MSSFEDVLGLAEVLATFRHPWFISGGWAIDLLVGRVTREHSDVEVGVFRADQLALRRHLAGWELYIIDFDQGGVWVPWSDGETIEPPAHQLQARKAGTRPAEFDVFLNERVGDDWHSRRHPGLSRPAADVVLRSQEGAFRFSPPRSNCSTRRSITATRTTGISTPARRS